MCEKDSLSLIHSLPGGDSWSRYFKFLSSIALDVSLCGSLTLEYPSAPISFPPQACFFASLISSPTFRSKEGSWQIFFSSSS